jgi:DNA-binding SARP family transcriptional activator
MTWRDQSFKLSRRQARGLIYYLADVMEPVSRDRLCFLFWPDISEAEARRKLSRLVSLLRGDLPQSDLLLVENETISIDPDQVWSDAAEFARLYASPSSMAKKAAVDLYRGAFLDGFSLPKSPEYDLWISEGGSQYERLYLSTLAELIKSKTESHDLASAIQYAQAYLVVDELAEDIHRQLITLYAANGDQTAAMRQMEICTLALERELGVEPLPETRGAFQAAQAGEVSLQPTLETKPTWTILPSLDLPLIGREEAWESLENAYRRFQNGGLIFISGEPGIGKSRLLQEFATSRNRLVLSGNCHASTQTLPYQPLVQALRQALSLPQLWEGIRPIWLTETSRLLPELSDQFPDLPQPVEVEPDQAQARLYEALTQCALGLAAKAPTLLCLDDAHWADEATQGWLTYLSTRLATSSLCVLSTYRIEEASKVSNLRRSFSRINLLAEVSLSGLTTGAIGQVLEGLPQPAPHPGALADRIHTATGGNTFFILETIRSLLESDLLSSPPTELPLADTVQEVVGRRLDRLSSVARQVLEAAAVLSPDLHFELLQETAGRSALELADGLDELFSHQLLTNGDQHSFKHDLIRQVAYLGLSPWRRQLLHQRAAEALEQVYRGREDEVAAQIAQHYDAAGEAEAALGYFQLAAIVAQGRYAHDEAITFLERAIDLSAEIRLEPQIIAQLHELLGDSQVASGGFEAARQAYEDSLAQIPAEEVIHQGEIQRKLARTFSAQRRLEETDKAYETALALLGPGPEDRGVAWQSTWLEIQLARLELLYFQVKLDQLYDLLRLVKPTIDEIGTPKQHVDYYFGQWRLLAHQERFSLTDESVRISEKALHAAQEMGDAATVADAQFALGFCLLWANDLEAAAGQLTNGLDLAEETGVVMTQCLSLTYLTHLYRLKGDAARTRSYAERSLESAQRLDIASYIAAAHSNLAWLDWRDRKLVQAEREAQKALALWGEFSHPFKWTAHWILCDIRLNRDQLADAVESARAMLHPAQQRLPDNVTAALEGAVRSWQEQDVGNARRFLEQAVGLARAKGYL